MYYFSLSHTHTHMYTHIHTHYIYRETLVETMSESCLPSAGSERNSLKTFFLVYIVNSFRIVDK